MYTDQSYETVSFDFVGLPQLCDASTDLLPDIHGRMYGNTLIFIALPDHRRGQNWPVALARRWHQWLPG